MDYSSLVEAGGGLNPRIFSFPRLALLGALAPFEQHGALFSELQSALGFNDGVLQSNLKALTGMGYVKFEKVTVSGKEVTNYRITSAGFEEFLRVKSWLKEFVERGEEGE